MQHSLKTTSVIFLLALGLFFSCTHDEEQPVNALGTVHLFDGADCTCVINFDNGINVVPNNYPSEFTFYDGQRVEASYQILSDDAKCDNAKSALIHAISELDAKPYVDLYFYNYDSLANDAINVLGYELLGDVLNVEVGYSGCSSMHAIELIYMHPSCGTPPIPPPTFELRHNSGGELCEMYITETRSFDMSALQGDGTNEILFAFCYNNAGETKCDEIIYRY